MRLGTPQLRYHSPVVFCGIFVPASEESRPCCPTTHRESKIAPHGGDGDVTAVAVVVIPGAALLGGLRVARG